MTEITAQLLAFESLLADDYLYDIDPNCYLISTLLDSNIDWEWDIDSLNSLSDDKIATDLKNIGYKYWKSMAKHIKRGIAILANKYDGDASNIWQHSSTKEIHNRFIEFGIGQKKASVAVNALLRSRRISAHDRDIPYTKHVRQVFLRSGLVSEDDEIVIINKAREEHPEYPGIMDKPCEFICSHYCFNTNPDCNHCPIGSVCARKVEYVAR